MAKGQSFNAAYVALGIDGRWERSYYLNEKDSLHGTAYFYYDDGMVRGEVPYREGLIHGQVLVRNPNGLLEKEANYKEGKLHGRTTLYYDYEEPSLITHYGPEGRTGSGQAFYESGTVEYIGNYVNDERQGVFQFYNEDGSLKELITYEQGIKEGLHTVFEPASNLPYQYVMWSKDKVMYSWPGKLGPKKPRKPPVKNGNGVITLYRPTTGAKLETITYTDGEQTGLHIIYYEETGKPFARSLIKNGAVVDTLKMFYEDGTLARIAYYDEEGVQNGWEKLFHENGAIKSMLYYVDNKLDSVASTYSPSGKLLSKLSYQEDLIHGPQLLFWENGKPKQVGMADEGDLVDSLKLYHENGQLAGAGPMYENDRDGFWTFYDEVGRLESEGNYAFDLRDSLWTYYYADGKVSQKIWFEDGLELGPYFQYYENGQIMESGYYWFGAKDSTWQYFHESGKLCQKIFYTDGIIDSLGTFITKAGKELPVGNVKFGEGEAIMYHLNGNKQAEGLYQDAEKVGVWKYYYADGQLRSVGNYSEGLENGTWSFYHPNGKLKAVLHYVEGELYGESQFFDAQGKLLGASNLDDEG